MPQHVRAASRCAGRQISGGNLDDLDIVFFNAGADLQVIGRHDHFHSGVAAYTFALQVPVDVKTCNEAEPHCQAPNHQQTCAIHPLASAAVRVPDYCKELPTLENTLLALDPIKRMVPTTITRMTASMTAYSAISCPSSSHHSLRDR